MNMPQAAKLVLVAPEGVNVAVNVKLPESSTVAASVPRDCPSPVKE